MERIIECQGIHYQQLNAMLRQKVAQGEKCFTLRAVCGQRYLAAGLKDVKLAIEGTPGNNLAAMMDGAAVEVKGNAQDGLGDTMNDGKVVVWGNAGDLVGYGMRGGTILIKGRVGSRAGIHMKGIADRQPAIVVGGAAGDFLGEYMAGGRIVVLGQGQELKEGQRNPLVGNYLATGIHGGKIYVRGLVAPEQVAPQVNTSQVTADEDEELKGLVAAWTASFGVELPSAQQFTLIQPQGVRPYAHLYTHQ